MTIRTIALVAALLSLFSSALLAGPPGRLSSIAQGPIVGLSAVPIRAPYVCVRNIYISPAGSDGNDGLSLATPKLSVFDVLLNVALVAGDCVQAAPGVYSCCTGSTAITVRVSGSGDTPAGYIAFVSTIPHQAKFRCPSNTCQYQFFIMGDYIVLDGFDLQGVNDPNIPPPMGYTGSCVKVGHYSRIGHHIKIINNILHDCGGDGVGYAYSDYITVAGNVVYGNSHTGSNAYSGIGAFQQKNFDQSSGIRNLIQGNIVYGNGMVSTGTPHTDGNGIIIDSNRQFSYSGMTLISGNLVFGNGGRGIHILTSDHGVVSCNVVYENGLDPLVTSRGEITNQVASDWLYANNIAVANPALANNNVAYSQTESGQPDWSNVWRNNFMTFDDGTATSSAFFALNGPLLQTQITALGGNKLGSVPKFIGPESYNFGLMADSPALGSACPGATFPWGAVH